ncbi:MAG: glutathione S-transferase N-terminal domain-containing protein [Xanthomonadaceae bacterium]|nr:glutathione S-transferase N-terminal domain-containing protein [Xanthomonadaceae bacterium]
MKLHTCAQAPNPRRVHLFLAAKKVEIDTREIDLRAEEHQSEAFRALNRHCTVPVLELDDGTCLSESIAICRYLEDIFPEPALMGTGAVERARIADIEHWIEINGLLAVTEAFRNSAAGLATIGFWRISTICCAIAASPPETNQASPTSRHW